MSGSVSCRSPAFVALVGGAVSLQLAGLILQSQVVLYGAMWGWSTNPPQCKPKASDGISFSSGNLVGASSTAKIVCNNGGVADPAEILCPISKGISAPDNGWWAICGYGNACPNRVELSATCTAAATTAADGGAVGNGGATTADGGAVGNGGATTADGGAVRNGGATTADGGAVGNGGATTADGGAVGNGGATTADGGAVVNGGATTAESVAVGNVGATTADGGAVGNGGGGTTAVAGGSTTAGRNHCVSLNAEQSHNIEAAGYEVVKCGE